MNYRRFVLTALFLITLFINGFAQTRDYKNLFNEQKLKSTVKFLSDDGFEGRAPGSRGGELAAKYIANQLEMIGAQPGNNGSYFQPVSLVSDKAGPNTTPRSAEHTSELPSRQYLLCRLLLVQ